MPIYEFRCRNCSTIFEVVQSMNKDTPLCPACGKPDVEKLISAPASVGVSRKTVPGATCCGRRRRCDSPPCGSAGECRRDEP